MSSSTSTSSLSSMLSLPITGFLALGLYDGLMSGGFDKSTLVDSLYFGGALFISNLAVNTFLP